MLMLELDDKREAIVDKLGTGSGVGTLDDGGLTQDERMCDGENAVVSRFW
jgi:hypothetical protein